MPEYHFSNSNAHLQLLSTCSCRIFLADFWRTEIRRLILIIGYSWGL